MKKKILWIVLGVFVITILGLFSYCLLFARKIITIDMEKLTIQKENIKIYEKDEFDQFIKDYQNHKLGDVYITKFLFDGVGMYKAPDLDDYIEKENDLTLKPLETTVFNINALGNYELQGTITGGMIAVNTNSLKGNINLILNNANIDTDSKKIPAIYVYHKDILNTDCKVTIEAKKNTKNKIEGGKLKKVSLLGKDDLDTYKDKYSGDVLNHYNSLSNYYGIYAKEELSQILFATTTADREDLMDGDPYYYYKASGAISSDIDLYFQGKGYLEVVSKNKEGIESKGNITLSGGVGDYKVTSFDDCLNTTTDFSENKNAHNTITIDVHSLTAIVNTDAEEGDAIDSNGSLTINGGEILALSQFGADSGLDAEKGIFINKGEVLATQSMMDSISGESKQRFVSISMNQDKDSLITMLDKKDKVVFAFQSDRRYSTLIYSSSKLKDNTYHFYQEGTIKGNSNYGFYHSGTYKKGTQLGYSSVSHTSKNEFGGMNGGTPPNMNGERPEMPNGETPPEMNGERPEMPNGETPPTPPQGQNGTPPEMNGERPELPNGEQPPKANGERPEMPNGEQPPEANGERPEMPNGEMPGMPGENNNMNPTNVDFQLSGITNIFSGVGVFKNE